MSTNIGYKHSSWKGRVEVAESPVQGNGLSGAPHSPYSVNCIYKLVKNITAGGSLWYRFRNRSLTDTTGSYRRIWIVLLLRPRRLDRGCFLSAT